MRPDQITSLLPEVVQQAAPTGSVIDGLVRVMAAHHQPVEDLLDDFGRYLNPYRCPVDFVPLLACWVGFDWLVEPDPAAGGNRRPSVTDGALRHLIFHAAELAKSRGTREGLRRTLELATGQSGFVITAASTGFAFEVRAPESARPAVELVLSIVDHDKPAFTTAWVAFGDERSQPLARLLSDRSANPLPGRVPAGTTPTNTSETRPTDPPHQPTR